MVRLVFRPYAQIRRSICTSEPLRPSTRVSSGFSLFRHSSPSFGSQQARSCSTPRTRPMGSAGDAPNERISPRLPSLCFRVSYCPTPRARVRLLGPCFKTGRRGRQPTHDRDADRVKHEHMLYMPAQIPVDFKAKNTGLEHKERTSPMPSV